MRQYTTPTSSVLYFLHGDYLGSTNLTTDADGNFVSRQLYDAWGNVRSRGNLPTDIGYTGQRDDSYIKLVQMGARWYDPAIGRWLSPDTIVPDPQNPQSLNRFGYVYNNPLKHTDPSGHCTKDDAVCQAYQKYLHDLFGINLVDGDAVWNADEARMAYDAIYGIAVKFSQTSVGADVVAMIKSIWDGVNLIRMHDSGNPFGNAMWTVPGTDGKMIVLPDGNGYWDTSNESWTTNTIAEELGHSWDNKGTQLGGLNGGNLSKGLVPAVGADMTGCLSYLICGFRDGDTAYRANLREPAVNDHAAFSPVEDWGGSFAQYVAYTPNRGALPPLREQYVRYQILMLALSVHQSP